MPSPLCIHTFDAFSGNNNYTIIGTRLDAIAAATQTANRVFYRPVMVDEVFVVRSLFVWNGATVSGNIDVGVYDAGFQRRVSSGSTVQAGTSTLQIFVTTPTTLTPGVHYLAAVLDNAVGTLFGNSGSSTTNPLWGAASQDGTFPLPATATPVALAQNRHLFIGMSQRTTY